MIFEFLNNNKAVLIARLGATESKAILYPKLPLVLKKIFKKIIFKRMYECAGFFPVNQDSICKFSQLYYDDLKILDIFVCFK